MKVFVLVSYELKGFKNPVIHGVFFSREGAERKKDVLRLEQPGVIREHSSATKNFYIRVYPIQP